nr:MAG TPA: hypothetical protein [Caudoviricetes sp.]
MDCFNRLCPFRENTTSSLNRCECVACPNRCPKDMTYSTSNHTVQTEWNRRVENG